VLALTAANAPERGDLQERLAASIYQQGDAARSAGKPREAVAYFEKVASVAPASAVRATAQFDAAAALMALGDSAAALPLLEDFRRRFPQHPLQAQATPQLAAAYLAEKRWSQAAAELERIAAQPGTGPEAAELSRAALWQAAELHDKAVLGDAPAGTTPGPVASTATPAAVATARQAYTRYVQAYPAPLGSAVQARWRLAQLAELATTQAQAALATAQQQADAANAPLRKGAPPPPKGPSRTTLKALADGVKQAQAAHTSALQAVVQADAAGGEARSPATRALAARATLALTAPVQAAYQGVKLVEPLQKQLKLKKQRFEEALKALAAVAEYGVADTTTAATFQTAALYQDFGRAMLSSERPKKLNKLELEQYNVLLEEQAYPFEEKAIALHEANAQRAAAGLYDEPVRQSFAALATLKPGRWGRAERAAATGSPAAEATARGMSLRQQGQFKAAAEAYGQAMAADAQAPAPVLNLAILHDLYLGDRNAALAGYERYLQLQQAAAGSVDNTVQRWVAELKARKPAAPAAPAAVPSQANTSANTAATTPPKAPAKEGS
jgi:tetratricopeptide (TPR) repeat protein